MERDSDLIGRYINISNKLKKKFLRKPNVAEGSEQFGTIARNLKEQECPQYAAFFSLAQARCEHTLVNFPGETQALIDSARCFLKAQHSNDQINCPNFDEHLNAAINCYSHAIRVCVEKKQNALAAAFCLELGNALKRLNRPSEAIAHYRRAAQLHTYSTLDSLSALEMEASCKIDSADHDGALNTLTEISSIIMNRPQLTGGSRPMGAYADILAKSELTRVILLLLLQPTPQRLGKEHAKMLEKYTWDSGEEDSPINYLQEDLFLLMQSIVLACQSSDIEALKSLQLQVWPMLNAEQNQLLHLVVNNVERPAGDGLE